MSHSKNILLLTLVHPDFLPPVYAVAQALRDEGYFVNIVTFDSYVPAHFDLGYNIEVLPVGRYHKQTIFNKWKLRQKFYSEALKKIDENSDLVISFCPFSFLTVLKFRQKVPHIYIALEIENFRFKYLFISPLSAFRNYLTFKRLSKAQLVATPSIQRSAWLAGRSNLVDMPEVIQNTSYYNPKNITDSTVDLSHIIPVALRNKRTFLYAGRLNDNYCMKELLGAFDNFTDDAVLIVTGVRGHESYSRELLEIHSNLKNKDRILLLGLVTRNEVLALQKYADVGVCLMYEYGIDEINGKMAAPNKVGEYISNGLYVLSTDIVYMSQFRNTGIATLVKDKSQNEILSGLQRAFKEVEKPGVKEKVLSFFINEFSMQKQMKPVFEYLNRSKS